MRKKDSMRNMINKFKTSFRSLVICGVAAALAFGQTPPPAQPAKPPAAKPATPPAAKPAAPASGVDNVISLVKSGMSEGLIIKTLQKQNKPMNLTPADLVKLQNAKVSENIIGVMMDPTSGPAPAAAAPAAVVEAPPPAPAPVASAPPPAAVPVSNPAPSAAAPGATTQAQKKRVMVDAFDYSTVMTSVQAVFGTQQNIGKGIQAMLVKRLAEQGKVVIVERAKIKELEAEQDRNVGNRVKQGSGARVGRISGADALLAGDIVIFGRDDKKKTVKGGGLIGGIGGAVANMNKEDKAIVAIDYRLVDAETSEVIATGEARGESSRKSKGFAGIAGALGKGVAGVEVDMTSSNFAETIIGEATMDCVNKLADILNKQAVDMKKTVREVEAYVADVAGRTMVISAGGNDGVNVGEVFEILKIVREVKDPVTKEVLDRITDKSGELTITSVRDKVATGSYVGSPAAVGYIARKKMQ
jgi:curli biogenesis system outer membrane secretion channel CsgG